MNIYRCPQCGGLTTIEPEFHTIMEWDSAGEQWLAHAVRACLGCIDYATGGFGLEDDSDEGLDF